MPTPQSTTVSTAARLSGGGWSLLTDVETVCYATGYAEVIEVGRSPFAGGPTAALVSPNGEVWLLVTNLEFEAATSSGADGVVSYVGYGYERADPLVANYRHELVQLLQRCRVEGTVAVELRSLPATAASVLTDRGCELVEISAELDRGRAIKTEAEIEKLRQASALSDLGQVVALTATRPGLTELEVFAELRSAWEGLAGQRVPVTGDFLGGSHRTAAVGGWPGVRPFAEGDLVIADLAPRHNGYWTDSCNTFAVGTPSTAARNLHAVVRHALEAGREMLRAGCRACDVDAAMRAVVGAAGYHYPHHSGHGIGTSVHEYPRLVPGEPAVLQPGMVVLLEPGAYDRVVGGIRLESMFLIGEQDAELISQFEHRLEV